FGQKDAQQAAMIRRLVADLDLPARIEVVPTQREPDRLALSSRNLRLSPGERERAVALHRALQAIATAIRNGSSEPATALAGGRAELEAAGIEPEYLALVNPDDFTPARSTADEVLAVVAARVGETRLIDNTLITPNGRRQ
ncbi:MAG TPA: pantoate--beta-alanine ligase, partial [Candidatus Limnocylindria bacterium]|nr:pantoate--beta-alanine ligase [Candidatus Limnocylindria bacterium]